MGEHWITAKQVVELGVDRLSLCARLHLGLSKARATSCHVNNKRVEWLDLPPEFWWAEGHEALQQDWEAGDFSTWIKSEHHFQAFGVRFLLPDVLAMLPFERRAVIARQLSVAGDPAWLSARTVREMVYQGLGKSLKATEHVIEQAALGFVAARAVDAWGYVIKSGNHPDMWQERWSVPEVSTNYE